MKQILLFVFTFTLLSGCSDKPLTDPELDNLVGLLVGEFSNEQQAKDDSGYAHLNLVNVIIWQDRPGYWVYSELYDAKENNNIYGQRILKYERVDSTTFKNMSYKIPNAKYYQSGWKNKSVFDKLTIDSLEIRDGCDVYFKKNTSTIYSGKTNKKFCSSSITNVEYITANFVISREKISIWNRGYNNLGKQIWGKIKGPYKYQRISKKK